MNRRHMHEVSEQTVPISTRIIDQAMRRIGDSPFLALRRVTCEEHEGTLILHGRVPSFHHKQVAQETVRNVYGVQRIVNLLQVQR